MRTDNFEFPLPPELIAQAPAAARDQSRLLVLHRASHQIEHRSFPALLEYLRPGDVLVLNNSRVIHARLRGASARTGGKFEIFLLEENLVNDWWAMVRPGKRARVGTEIVLLDPTGRPLPARAMVLEKNNDGRRRVRFDGTPNIFDQLDAIGEVPLPPYIRRKQTIAEDRERYQTVYAAAAGSVAAPTAGLHFTESLLAEIRARGVEVCFVTLHVGLGTFAPVKTDTLSEHAMHEERYELSEATARTVQQAKASGHRVIAVGTTSVRVLESVAAANAGALRSGASRTRIFIYPPYEFRIVDALLTNFHLPRSTLLMLASAFVAPKEIRGREVLLSTYAEAIRERYRFFSYGDAMLIL